MAKGDHAASGNKLDEQQQQAQGYLAQTQGQLGNQYGNMYNMYMGPNAPTYGSVNNWGSTTPNYSLYSNPFAGNKSGTTVGNNPYSTPNSGMTGGPSTNGSGWSQDVFNQIFPGDSLSPQQLEAAAPQLAQYGIKVHHNAEGVAGKLEMPDGTFVDVIGGAGSGENRKQYLTGGGGFGGGMMGGGGIPGMNMQDYTKLMGMYGNLFGDMRGQYGSFIGSASNMANTGGLSEGDKANIRSRAISPIRSVYSQGLQNLNRQRALQGGYSPGYTTALGRFNRQEGQATSDATTNAEASIAELVQKGKLGGLSAWGSGLAGEGNSLSGILGGMGNLYGTEPGMSRLFGDQVIQSMGQQLQAAQLQNQLGLGLINGQNQIGSSVPGNTQGFLNNAKGIMGLGQGAAGAIAPWLKQPYNPNLPPGPNNDPGRPGMNPNNPYLIDGDYQAPIPGEIYGGGGYGYGGQNPYGSGGYGGDPSYGGNPNNPYIPGPYMPYDPNNPGYQL